MSLEQSLAIAAAALVFAWSPMPQHALSDLAPQLRETAYAGADALVARVRSATCGQARR